MDNQTTTKPTNTKGDLSLSEPRDAAQKESKGEGGEGMTKGKWRKKKFGKKCCLLLLSSLHIPFPVSHPFSSIIHKSSGSARAKRKDNFDGGSKNDTPHTRQQNSLIFPFHLLLILHQSLHFLHRIQYNVSINHTLAVGRIWCFSSLGFSTFNPSILFFFLLIQIHNWHYTRFLHQGQWKIVWHGKMAGAEECCLLWINGSTSAYGPARFGKFWQWNFSIHKSGF